MKRIVCMLAFALSVWSVQAADINNISNAFKEGNAQSLSSAMDKEVDMALLGSSKKCKGEEAVALLASFFKKHKPAGFTVVHHADKQDTGFFVAKLPTEGGQYRVNVTYRAEGNKVFIQSIRIE